METENSSMSPAQVLIPVHGMHYMSLWHIITFTSCVKAPRISRRLDEDWLYLHVPGTWISSCSWHAWYGSGTYRHINILYQNPSMIWRQDGDWLYFHVPGTWISSSSWHAWYIPGTYRYIYILYQNPTYVIAPGWRMIIIPCPRTWISSRSWHAWYVPVTYQHIYILYEKKPLCHAAWMEVDYISMSPGHEWIPVHEMRDMSRGHIDTFTFCIKTPRYVMAPGWVLIIFSCPRDMN